MTLHVHMQAASGRREVFAVLSSSPVEAITTACKIAKRDRPTEGFRPLYVATTWGEVL